MEQQDNKWSGKTSSTMGDVREMTQPTQRIGQATGDNRVHAAKAGETEDAGASATAPAIVEERDIKAIGAIGGGVAARGGSAQEHLTGQQPTVLLIDELAGPEDYWLTLTDAARISRRQEVTIRRWVAAGHLPVRRQPMGLTKRTRHVRASDLARLTPIIDPAAAISDATAHLDLVSIPQQQAQVQAAQLRLTSDVARLVQQASGVAAEVQAVREQLRVTEARHHTLEQLAGESVARTTTLETQLAKQRTAITAIETTLAALQEQWSALAEEGRAVATTVTQLEATLREQQQRAAGAEQEQRRLGGEAGALRKQLAYQAAQQHAHADRLAALEVQLAALREQQQTHAQTIAQQTQHLETATAQADQVRRRHERALAQLEDRFAAHAVDRQQQHDADATAQAALAARVDELEQQVARLAAGRRIRSRVRGDARRRR